MEVVPAMIKVKGVKIAGCGLPVDLEVDEGVGVLVPEMIHNVVEVFSVLLAEGLLYLGARECHQEVIHFIPIEGRWGWGGGVDRHDVVIILKELEGLGGGTLRSRGGWSCE